MRRFSLAQLEAFDAICRLGTFHAAAAALHVTQPTITLRIHELEGALNTELFVRRGRTALLSAEGRVIAQYVAQELLLLDEMEQQLRTGNPLQGSLRLGSNDMIAITCLPEIIQMLEATYPRLKVELKVATSVALGEMLNSDLLDMAILADPQVKSHISVETLALAEVAWVGGSGRRVGGSSLRPKDLQGVNVLTIPPPSTLNTIIKQWCSSERVPTPLVSTCNSIAIIAKLVGSGVAMSVLPVCIVHREIESGTVLRYRHQRGFAALKVCVAHRKSITSATVTSLLRVTRDVMSRSGLFQMLSP